jgi:hypothetical protein
MPASSSPVNKEDIMKGDFTRDTFDPVKHFTRVLMQQGRVQLDADWNEQVSILLHYLQALVEDLVGPYGGPEDIMENPDEPDPKKRKIAQKRCGFDIALDSSDGTRDLKIGEGRYYVDGILCENKTWIDAKGRQRPTYYTQPDYPRDPMLNALPTGNFLVYLDVWERMLTSCEDGSIREVALGGPDTAARAKVVWQVKTWDTMPDGANIPKAPGAGKTWEDWLKDPWPDWVETWQAPQRGLLKAKAKEDNSQNIDACAVPPDARYRGTGNQLYRVEIHTGGTPGENPTFKWSRENGAVIIPIRKLEGAKAYLDHLGRDDRFGLKIGDWVEVVDDTIASHVEPNKPGALAQVDQIDPLDMTVILKAPKDVTLPTYAENAPGHPLLRRWDHVQRETTEADEPKPAPDGALLIEQNQWLMLEDGIQVYFAAPEKGAHQYRTGDYWLIPARTATGDVEWPKETDDQGQVIMDSEGRPIQKALPPHGVEHHYAPLWIVSVDSGKVTVEPGNDCRRKFKYLWLLKSQ